MANILIYALHYEGAINKNSLGAVSEGARLAGDLFVPQAEPAEAKLPAILFCHGWGGVKSHLNSAYAPFFASHGWDVREMATGHDVMLTAPSELAYLLLEFTK